MIVLKQGPEKKTVFTISLSRVTAAGSPDTLHSLMPENRGPVSQVWTIFKSKHLKMLFIQNAKNEEQRARRN